LALLASKTIPDTACTRCTSLCNCFQRASIVDWPIFNFFAKEPLFSIHRTFEGRASGNAVKMGYLRFFMFVSNYIH
jgi:hypothetical protein